jgi:hypothetical protein
MSRLTASVMLSLPAVAIARKDVRHAPPSQGPCEFGEFPSNGRLLALRARRYHAARMSLLVSLAAVAASVTIWFRYERDRQASAVAYAALEEQVRQLTMRLDVAEHDAVAASSQAEVAERVLLEKGYADADDLESARRRLEGEAAGERDGGMH